jgi:small-conductance mechanosensitive channel
MDSKPQSRVVGGKKSALSLGVMILWIVIYIVITATFNSALPSIIKPPLFDFKGEILTPYGTYINVALALVFGYMIVRSLANFMYWTLIMKYPHSTAAAVRSIVVLIGIGGLLAAIAGGVAGGAAGVALGGFLALVIGFASQQVMGQAIAGLFILLTRPFKHGDYVSITGEQGVVEDITSLFTIIRKDDGTTVLIPSSSIIGNKIYFPVRQQKS